MSMRCSKHGISMIPRYDWRTGEDVYICPLCSSNTEEPDERRPERDVEMEEVVCPECEGTGEYKGAEDIYRCDRCMGSRTIRQEVEKDE